MDIKATVDPSGKVMPGLYQLLGYVLLDYTDRYRIQEVALYMARQGVLLKWSLDDLLRQMTGGDPAPLVELRERFQAVVRSTGAEKATA